MFLFLDYRGAQYSTYTGKINKEIGVSKPTLSDHNEKGTQPGASQMFDIIIALIS